MNTKRQVDWGSERILHRIRVYMFRQAFDRYKAGVARKKKEELVQSRVAMLMLTNDERLKQRCFESIQLFVERHLRAKNAFRRLDVRLNISRQRQGFKRWQRWNQKKLERQLNNEQKGVTEQVVKLNEKQGALFQHDED